MAKPNGVVIYQGPSRIDGAPIVVIAVGLSRGSQNSKTGAMVQTHILREDVNPLEALASGADASICGGCRHRPKVRNVIKTRKDGTQYLSYGERSCYVNVSQAPLVVWRAFRAGKYPVATTSEIPAMFAGRNVRLGSYGDPAAVPLVIWQLVTSQALGHTGYTHQWKSERLRDVTALCQASVDSIDEAHKARSLGLGYFRVKSASDAKLDNEIVCPASAEAGKVLDCNSCRMCAGSTKRLGVVIDAHGIGVGAFEKQESARRSLKVLSVA